MLKEATILQVIPRPNDTKKNILVQARHGNVSLNTAYYFHTKKSADFSKQALEGIFSGKTIHQIAKEPDELSGTKVKYLKTKKGEYTDTIFYPHTNQITAEAVGELLSEL